MSHSTPDAGVRRARAADAPAVGLVHARAWTASYRGLLPAAATPAAEELAAAWSQAVEHPPSARHQVLVATAGDRVVGFAALAPSGDADAEPASDAELLVLLVDPSEAGAGHGSRLLNASVDVLRDGGFTRVRAWVPVPDVARHEFLTEAGFAPDGAGRLLDATGDGTTTVREVRLSTVLESRG